MDLGIQNRLAIVCGASRGLGRAIAARLAAEGVNLVLVARSAGPLEEAAQAIRSASGVNVRTVVTDLSTPDGRTTLLAAAPNPDILVHNGGWPTAWGHDFRKWTRADWLGATDAMLLGPVELITGVLDGMIERRFGRIIAVTSRFVKEPPLSLALSTSPRLGLAGFLAGIAREAAPYNVTANAVLPGIFATETQVEHGHALARAREQTIEEVWRDRASTNSAKRFGTPEEFADLCAYLSSAQSGFVTGQNILIDGGGYPGVF